MYVDECGIKEHIKREYGRAAAGVKVEDCKRGRNSHCVNVVAAVIHGENGARRFAPEYYGYSMTGEKFELWVRNKISAPSKLSRPCCPISILS